MFSRLYKILSLDCRVSSMGSLVGVLGGEEDLLQRILLLLDPVDLHSAEMACSQLRSFVVRKQTWRRKLEQDFSGCLLATPAPNPGSEVELHAGYKQRYAEMEEAVAAFKWEKFCQSWMTVMTISSMYTFLHPKEETEDVEFI